MNVPTKLAAFAVALALVFGGAVLVGAAVEPSKDSPAAERGGHGGDHNAETTAPEDHAGDAPASTGGDQSHDAEGPTDDAHPDPDGSAVPGLAVSDGDYTLEVDRTRFAARSSSPLRFRIADDRGRAVRDGFEVEHEKELHMIVVRRDTQAFQHVHPHRADDGTWTVDLNTSRPGVYRAYADFKLGGKQRTLATDLFVPGEFDPKPLPAPETDDRAVDEDGSASDIDVSLKASPARAGQATQLTFAATRNGRPLAKLDPYLGAKGHLVALREGDLAYLHVHPAEHDGHSPTAAAPSTHEHANETTFTATYPTAGRYRLFLQFKTGGRIHTADYTVEVSR